MLKVEIEGEDLVIRLSPEVLKSATELCPALEQYNEATHDFSHPEVTDIAVWRKEVLIALNHEEEDGTTPIHRMFDQAFEEAINQGAQGIRIPGLLDKVDLAAVAGLMTERLARRWASRRSEPISGG